MSPQADLSTYNDSSPQSSDDSKHDVPGEFGLTTLHSV